MKRSLRILCLVIAVVLLPLQVSFAQEAESSAALLSVTYYDSNNKKGIRRTRDGRQRRNGTAPNPGGKRERCVPNG